MNPKLITIITVCFNAEKTIEKTILSIINQTYANIEFIIIDGGSTDGTIDIIKKYEDKISSWISEPDRGIYDAMNKGIDLAKGEWINFMNSGDLFYDENTITDIFESLKGQDINRISIIYGKTLYKYTYGDYIVTPSNLKNIKKEMPFCHQSTFTKSEILKKEPFDLKYKICADHFSFLTIYNLYPNQFYYIPIPISIFDAINGISSNNYVTVNNELQQITKSSSNIFYSFFKKNILNKLPSFISQRAHQILYFFNKRFHKI